VLTSLIVLVAFFVPGETIESGKWNVENVVSIRDSCNISKYRNPKKIAPTNFIITNTSLSSFSIGETKCSIIDFGFTCKEIYLSFPALLNTAKMSAKVIIRGELKSRSFMKLDFDITIATCNGAGCFFIKRALDFPCLINLKAEGRI
tara:strand:- start:4114 stop:4554 length:441 start_codon:yes stop_codon:yes gene_type:complete